MNEKELQQALSERCYQFSLKIVRLILSLQNNNFVVREIARQFIRSGTSIGANLQEALGALTRKEFACSMNIAKKEARETKYWLEILIGTKLVKEEMVKPLLEENVGLINIFTKIVKTCQEKEIRKLRRKTDKL